MQRARPCVHAKTFRKPKLLSLSTTDIVWEDSGGEPVEEIESTEKILQSDIIHQAFAIVVTPILHLCEYRKHYLVLISRLFPKKKVAS